MSELDPKEQEGKSFDFSRRYARSPRGNVISIGLDTISSEQPLVRLGNTLEISVGESNDGVKIIGWVAQINRDKVLVYYFDERGSLASEILNIEEVAHLQHSLLNSGNSVTTKDSREYYLELVDTTYTVGQLHENGFICGFKKDPVSDKYSLLVRTGPNEDDLLEVPVEID